MRVLAVAVVQPVSGTSSPCFTQMYSAPATELIVIELVVLPEEASVGVAGASCVPLIIAVAVISLPESSVIFTV